MCVLTLFAKVLFPCRYAVFHCSTFTTFSAMPRIRITDTQGRERFRTAFDSSGLSEILVTAIINGNREEKHLDAILVDDCEKFAYKIEDLRETYDAETHARQEQHARSEKEKHILPVWFPGGIVNDAGQLVEFSGLAGINIDLKDNPGFKNAASIKAAVQEIPFVAYCGLSCRGAGVLALVHFPADADENARFLAYFMALGELFRLKGITIDYQRASPQNGRFLSLDRNAYWNFAAETFRGSNRPASDLFGKDRPTPAEIVRARVERIIELAEARDEVIAYDFDDWLRMGHALANEFGEKGRGYFLRLSALWERVSKESHRRDPGEIFDYCLSTDTGKVKIATFFYMASYYGISFKE